MGIDPKSLAAFAANSKQPPKKQRAPAVTPEPEEPLEDRCAELLPLLEEFASDIEEITTELDSDSLLSLEDDLSEDEAEALKDGFGSLDPRLKAALRAVADLPLEECTRLADSLESDGVVSDQERICGWLWRTCQMLSA